MSTSTQGGFTDPLRPCGPSLRPPKGPDMRPQKIRTFRRGDAVARAVIGSLTKIWPRTKWGSRLRWGVCRLRRHGTITEPYYTIIIQLYNLRLRLHLRAFSGRQSEWQRFTHIHIATVESVNHEGFLWTRSGLSSQLHNGSYIMWTPSTAFQCTHRLVLRGKGPDTPNQRKRTVCDEGILLPRVAH